MCMNDRYPPKISHRTPNTEAPDTTSGDNRSSSYAIDKQPKKEYEGDRADGKRRLVDLYPPLHTENFGYVLR